MNVRLFTSEDHPVVSKWWKHHGWAPVSMSHLSKTGFMVEDEKHQYCAGWIYLVADKLAWVEFVVANPDAPLKSKYVAINALVKQLLSSAKLAGISAVFSSLKNKGLERIYKRCGFVVTDTEVTHYLATI